MKKEALTIIEILLTILIIGVVASLTIPAILSTVREKIYISRLKNTYSIFSRAYKLAIAINDSPEGWDIGEYHTYAGAEKLYNVFKPYLKVAKICGSKRGCFYSGTYKSLFGVRSEQQPDVDPPFYRGVLMNGVSFAFWSSGNESCKNTGSCGSIHIDINGAEPPNRAGVDYFVLSIRASKFEPAYPLGNANICKFNDKSNSNGLMCTRWAIEKGNMDYLRRDISKEY